MRIKRHLLACSIMLFTTYTYAEVTINEQVNNVQYDSINVFKPNGEILLRDAGVSYSSDQEIVLVSLDGKLLEEEVVLTNGAHNIQLIVWDMTGDHKSTTIEYTAQDIDYPVDIIKPNEEPTFTLNSNMTALDFAKSYMEIDAKDGIIYALIDGKQYVDTTVTGLHSGMLSVLDVNGDTDEMKIVYFVE